MIEKSVSENRSLLFRSSFFFFFPFCAFDFEELFYHHFNYYYYFLFSTEYLRLVCGVIAAHG